MSSYIQAQHLYQPPGFQSRSRILSLMPLLNILFMVTVIELFLGGGGRLTAVGPISLRMVLFAACVSMWLLVLFLYPERKDTGLLVAVVFVLVYLVAHVGAVAVGAVSGFDLLVMLGEMQQSAYWLAAPFFAYVLQSRTTVARVAMLVQFATILLAVSYLVIIGLMLAQVIDAGALRSVMADSRELFFRGDSFFFYKGFLYLGVGAVFFVALQGRNWVVLVILVIGALVLTLTRGLLLSVILALFLMLLFQRRWKEFLVFVGLSSIAGFMVLGVLPGLDDVTAAQRLTQGKVDPSILVRLEDMKFVLSNASANTLVFGEGFGSLINGRSNIENTYLWALWKLGVLGVVFWLLPILMSSWYYFKIPSTASWYNLATAYYFGSVFIYLQTATNPFLNNPIGLSFVIISLFSLRTLTRSSVVVSSRVDAR